MKNKVLKIYDELYRIFGQQHWWPGDSIDEIIIGAVLTQNTNWDNVSRAIKNLTHANKLSLKKISSMNQEELSVLIKPSGYYNLKAKRLQAVARFFVDKYNCDYELLKKKNCIELRKELLDIYGVGYETADSILLYCFDMPTFVVDAYTKRMGERHNLFPANSDYHQVKEYFTKHLPLDKSLFNEFHALIVKIGKDFCRAKPNCEKCPLNDRKFYNF